ncbi:MAG: hypothetical protein KF841_11545 [Phycisphaerae bacterium]|nr:hypothetical protein [Phycisphaerae bacterium]
MSLQVWNDSAKLERTSRFSVQEEGMGRQWFVRILRSAAMPPGCTYQLSDRFDFVIVTRAEQWDQLARATNLDAAGHRPDFSRGVVVGLAARIGESRPDQWPIVVSSVRQRGRVAFLYGEFRDGFYRPLMVPPYLHLVYVANIETLLGVKINQMLFGFNVEIEQLNQAGIR